MNKFRYIDKKILCSYDLSEEFFKELGVEVYDIIPLRKVFVIFTDKDKKILKRINSSEERVEFINKALNIIKEKDKYILQYCVNSTGDINPNSLFTHLTNASNPFTFSPLIDILG